MPFKKGHVGMGGRPKSPRTIEKEKALVYIAERVTKELKPIIDKEIEQAKEGDKNAREDLLNRAYGKPKETIEHQGLDFTWDVKE